MFETLLKQQVRGVMRILGQDDGLAPFITYIGTGERVYDPTTRSYNSTDTNYENIPAVLAKFKVDEIDESVVSATDLKVLIAALDLPVVPKTQDQVQTVDGSVFNVERLLGVPGDSLHVLHVRKV